MNAYAAINSTIQDQITKYGFSVTIKRTTSVYDTVSGGTTDTTTNLSSVGLYANIDDAYTKTHNVVAGDRLVMLNANETPQMTDKLVLDGEDWTIASIDRIAPGNVDLSFKVQVRQ